jgi:glycosyltransferase involved in cell wall biosynthesis/folate-dependent phosphoribosylglycinamide formyltransferase PurN/peptidoglycan/xylan/chitin deacetylase (PgdA/CDA1 family)
MTARLRVVVFTAGEITPGNRVFFERLAKDPLLDLAAIVVDEYRPRRKPLLTRIVRALRQDGPRWIAFKIRSTFAAMLDRAALRVADKIHGPRRMTADLPATIHRVSDIHSAESIELIRSLSPDLGIIEGGRILSDSVIAIPKHGTLNIHKRKLPEYRGGGPVGYWEILAGEPSIGVSIHFATRDVDAGPVIAQTTIPIEEGDTLASLKLKANIRGAELYIDAIRRVAKGEVTAISQDLSRGKTYRAPSDYKVWALERRLERASGTASLTRLRLLVQFLIVSPHLQRVRRKLVRQQRAPISIFFYHLVSNRPLNHMCLPLMAFVRQIEFLKRYYAILSLDEAVERLRSGRNREIAASITFDDGYRDNAWAIDYLRYFEIPATFFVSIGHVRDGSAFEHDRRRGYENARPMSESDVQQLVASGFTVGSHGVHHEDFGCLTTASADRILSESRAQIREVCGQTPSCFAFPKGQRGANITRPTLDLALKHYASVFSAYGGYSFPEGGRRHFLRISNPTSVFDLNLIMSGYTGFRDCLAGNAWGLKTEKLDPCGSASPKTAIALIAASPSIIGGHSVQAQALAAKLSEDGHEVRYVPIDVRFPRWLQPIRRVRYARTIVNELLYVLSLGRLARVDVVHVFSASYWSFLLGPAPAILIANLLRKPVVLHYHSGEADDHLKRWRFVVRPLMWLADEIVVPSTYLQRVFASHGYRARVIPNVVQTWRFRYRERSTPRPRLLSARNLEPHYRVERTINAFVRLKKRFPEATLTIAGCGSQDASLRALTEQLGVSGIHFVGAIDPAAMPKTYDAADIFVNTSVIDNQPVSILEAFAAGLPVVSTPTGDIPTMLRGGEAGVLVDSDDDAAVADAVTRLLDQPELSVRIARRAREEADRYTWRRVGAEWNTLYAELLSSGGERVLAHGA